jgi:predicted nuclease of predicted toxin-antitoxin system
MTHLKLDENLSDRVLTRMRAAGLDTESVRTQKLSGTADEALFDHCRTEQRTLITLDLDFSNPLRFSPVKTAGTIVLRPNRPSMPEINALIETVIRRLEVDSPKERIWIVEAGRVRIFSDWNSESE